MSEDAKTFVDRLAHGYREAQVLFTAVRLNLFEAVAAGANTVPQLTDRLGTHPRGTRILADALAALGLLAKTGDAYELAPVARETLLPDAPHSQVAILRHGARHYERWGRLIDAVTTGAPIPDEALDPRLASDARSFAAAMRDVGRTSAALLAERLDLAGVSRMLDVGGGPGSYAIELARRRPELTAVVFDRPETAAVAAENARAAGVGDRVTARGGDAFADDLGGPYDLVLISNLLHIYGPEANARLVARAAAALAPRGRLCLKDFWLETDRTAPLGATLFAVNMLVSTEEGDGYTVEEATAWMTAAGLAPEPAVVLTPQSRLLIGRRP